MIKINTLINFTFKNNKYREQPAIIGYENSSWYIEVENQNEFNKIVKNKKFIIAKNLIDYCKKNKIIIPKDIKERILITNINKSIKIRADDYLFREEFVQSSGYNTSIVELTFNNKKAYLYIAEHGGLYHSAFGNNWKEQEKRNGTGSEIWSHIFSLDRAGYICFNDVYDKVKDEYDYDDYDYNNDDDDEDDEDDDDSGIESFALQKDNNSYIIIKFLESFKDNLAELKDLYYSNVSVSDRELILQSILHIYVTDKDFFNEHIDIDEESLEKLDKELQNSDAIKVFRKDKLNKELPIKLNRKKSSKI